MTSPLDPGRESVESVGAIDARTPSTVGEGVRLARVVRFTIPGDGGLEAEVAPASVNGYAGKPAMRGLGRYYELLAECAGEPDPVTGYLVSIKVIDSAVHSAGVPIIALACANRPHVEPADLLPELFAAVARALRVSNVRLVRLAWRLSPYYVVEMSQLPAPSTNHNGTTPEARPTVVIRQRFDFAAAHRLHASDLSDEDNREAFGRCNNPSGHGHNYRVEPAVRVNLDAATSFGLPDIERITHDTLIDPFDHTHLDVDRPEFGRDGVRTSSVENIARVFYDRLRPAIEAGSGGEASLDAVTVWETDRTSCTYPA